MANGRHCEVKSPVPCCAETLKKGKQFFFPNYRKCTENCNIPADQVFFPNYREVHRELQHSCWSANIEKHFLLVMLPAYKKAPLWHQRSNKAIKLCLYFLIVLARSSWNRSRACDKNYQIFLITLRHSFLPSTSYAFPQGHCAQSDTGTQHEKMDYSVPMFAVRPPCSWRQPHQTDFYVNL